MLIFDAAWPGFADLGAEEIAITTIDALKDLNRMLSAKELAKIKAPTLATLRLQNSRNVSFLDLFSAIWFWQFRKPYPKLNKLSGIQR